MRREQLEALGMSDQSLAEEWQRITASKEPTRVKKPSLAGSDTWEVQSRRQALFDAVTESWFRDPGLPE